MKCVIANRFAGGFLHPGVESGAQTLAFVLDGEVNERCRSTESCSPRAGLEIIGAGSASEGHIEVSVYIDSSRKDIFAGSIDDLSSVLARQALADGGNLSRVDGNIAGVSIGRSGDSAVNDDGVKVHGDVLSSGGEVEILC